MAWLDLVTLSIQSFILIIDISTTVEHGFLKFIGEFLCLRTVLNLALGPWTVFRTVFINILKYVDNVWRLSNFLSTSIQLRALPGYPTVFPLLILFKMVDRRHIYLWTTLSLIPNLSPNPSAYQISTSWF